MLQVIIEGRGGQGAQTAGTLLASAFFAEGLEVQGFATYGGARRGTPVRSAIRIDDRPIRTRSDIETADAILCFDASLLDSRLLSAARPQTKGEASPAATFIIVNSAHPPGHFAEALPGYCVVPVDGIGLARRLGLGRIVNSVLLGAFARALEAPPLAVLERAILAEAPTLKEANLAACEEGYRAVDAQLKGNAP